MITEADRNPADGAALPAWLRELLRCPVGGHELLDCTTAEGGPALCCAEDCSQPGRRRVYRIEDGIPVLLADEATWADSGKDER